MHREGNDWSSQASASGYGAGPSPAAHRPVASRQDAIATSSSESRAPRKGLRIDDDSFVSDRVKVESL